VSAAEGTHDGHAMHGEAAKHDANVKAEADAGAMSEDAVIAEQLPTYPLDTCPISGEELGGMGDAVNYVYEGRLVRFCCGNCKGDFLADPAATFAKIDAAVIEQQLPDYPLQFCPVSGEPLGGMGEPYNHVHGTRLVRFCCDGCVGKFEANPAAYFAKIDAAAAARAEAKE
jgi:YHS domain-containing protein